MAQIIPCDGPGHEPTAAVFLITLISEAETIGLCAACGCDWAQALLTSLAPERLAPAPAKRPRRPRQSTADAVADALDNAAIEAAEHATG